MMVSKSNPRSLMVCLACGRKGYFARSSVVIEMGSPDILLFGA